jgi:hypothetical protein
VVRSSRSDGHPLLFAPASGTGGDRAGGPPVHRPLFGGGLADGPGHALDLGSVLPLGCEYRAFRGPSSLDEFNELIRR